MGKNYNHTHVLASILCLCVDQQNLTLGLLAYAIGVCIEIFADTRYFNLLYLLLHKQFFCSRLEVFWSTYILKFYDQREAAIVTHYYCPVVPDTATRQRETALAFQPHVAESVLEYRAHATGAY